MNLIVCSSPLQVLIAERIVDNFPGEVFYAIMFYPESNEKYSYYTKRLLSKCIGGIYIQNKPRKNKIISLLKLIHLRMKSFFIPKMDKVFIANVDNIYFHFLLSCINFKELYSFDDGLANIVYSSGFYNSTKICGITKFIYKLLGNKYDYDGLKTLIKSHYTIYKDRKNIIENCVFLQLFNTSIINEKGYGNIYKKNISVLLGQPIYEHENFKKMDMLNKHVFLSEKVINKFNIEYYFPHPREDYIINNVKYIETNLIFEDYFIKNLRSDTFYMIYTFFSSAAIYWNNLPNVKVISIQPSDYSEQRMDCYNIIHDFGIDIYKIKL